MSNMNWDAMLEDAAAIGGSGFTEKQEDFEIKPRYYLTSDVDNYIRVVPYLDENGTPKLFRKVEYHSITTTFTTKAGSIEQSKKKILCQGKNCKFCEGAYKLKDLGVEQWYRFAKTVDYLLLGVPLELNAKAKKFVVSPKALTEDGTIKMGAVVLGGISKQPAAWDKLLKNDLISLPIEYPKEFGDAETAGQIISNIMSYDKGMVIKVKSSKMAGKWQTEMKVLPNYSLELPSSLINLETDYLNEKLYKQSTIDNALAQFQQQVAIKLGVVHPTATTSPTNALIGDTPWNESPVEISAEDEEVFAAFG